MRFQLALNILVLAGALAFSPRAEANGFADLCKHAFSKISELPYNEPHRIHELLFRTHLLLSKKTVESGKIRVGDLMAVHPVTFPPAIEKAEGRAKKLKEHAPEVLKGMHLTRAMMDAWIPSKNGIRAILDLKKQWVVFDGNGRMEAIRRAFPAFPQLLVDVELWTVDSKGVLKRLERVRDSNGAKKLPELPPAAFEPKRASNE